MNARLLLVFTLACGGTTLPVESADVSPPEETSRSAALRYVPASTTTLVSMDLARLLETTLWTEVTGADPQLFVGATRGYRSLPPDLEAARPSLLIVESEAGFDTMRAVVEELIGPSEQAEWNGRPAAHFADGEMLLEPESGVYLMGVPEEVQAEPSSAFAPIPSFQQAFDVAEAALIGLTFDRSFIASSSFQEALPPAFVALIQAHLLAGSLSFDIDEGAWSVRALLLFDDPRIASDVRAWLSAVRDSVTSTLAESGAETGESAAPFDQLANVQVGGAGADVNVHFEAPESTFRAALDAPYSLQSVVVQLLLYASQSTPLGSPQ